MPAWEHEELLAALVPPELPAGAIYAVPAGLK